MGGGVRAWLAHDTPSIVAKNDIVNRFWGAKVYFRRPFWPCECTFGHFFEKIISMQGRSRRLRNSIEIIFWGSVKDVVLAHTPP